MDSLPGNVITDVLKVKQQYMCYWPYTIGIWTSGGSEGFDVVLSLTVFLQDGKDMTITSIITKITSIQFYNNTVMKIKVL